MVQSRYRQIMRLLHPDKRGAMTESAQATCDQAIAKSFSVRFPKAMERVQEALAGLKKDWKFMWKFSNSASFAILFMSFKSFI